MMEMCSSVKEWLDEVRDAVLWYLGQPHRSRRAQQGRDGGHGGTGRSEAVQSKL